MVDIAKLQALAAEKGENQTEAQEGGSSFEIPAAGPGGARLISYIEIGKHVQEFPGKPPKEVEMAILEFELVGKRWPSKNEETGREKPFIIRLTVTKSLNEKANFFKLFNRLNYDAKAKHFAQLVGSAYKVTVVHKTSGQGAEARTYANLKDDSGYTIVPPFNDVDDGEGNMERKRVNFPEAVSPLKIFLWDLADKEQWDSLFIDGVFGEKKDKEGNVIEGSGQSKNWIQQRIMAAKNFKGSVIEGIIGGSDGLELEAETPSRDEPKAKKPKQDVVEEDEVDPLAED